MVAIVSPQSEAFTRLIQIESILLPEDEPLDGPTMRLVSQVLSRLLA